MKIKAVLKYYNSAIAQDDQAKPSPDNLIIDEQMYGRMQDTIQSYDLMDNKKYRDLESLLDIMTEAFGYNEDMHGLFKSEVFPSDLFTANQDQKTKTDNKVQKPQSNNKNLGRIAAFIESTESKDG